MAEVAARAGVTKQSVSNAVSGAEVVEEVENVLVSHGYNLLLATTRDDPEYARRHLENLAARSVDALLVAGDQGVAQLLPTLAEADFPVALFAWEVDPPAMLPVVSIDYEHAGYLAGRHLRDLGHESVAVIADLPAHAPRIAGLRRAFAADGLTIDDRMVFIPTTDDAAGGFACVGAALAANPEMTAIFTTHDLLACVHWRP